MKERYYNIIIRKEGYSYNEGFLKAKFDEKKQIIKMIGMLTEDVIIIDFVKDVFVFGYYEYNEFQDNNELTFRAIIEKDKFMIPGCYKYQDLTIDISNEVKDQKKIEMYDQIYKLYIGDES